MLIVLTGTAFALISFVCSLFILLHAFQRSVGTGVMVLCIPCFMIYYAFRQFEHRWKGVLIAGYLGGLVLASVFYAFGTQGLVTYFRPQSFG